MTTSIPLRRWLASALALSALLAAAPALAGSSWDSSSWDSSSWDSSSWDSSSWDSSSWDSSSWDSSSWDSSSWDSSSWDASQWDASQWDSSSWDSSSWDASQWDSSSWDASQWDAASFAGYDPGYALQWNLRAIHVPGAWAMAGPGDGALAVCVLDSGVDATHPDLAAQMWTEPATGAHGTDLVAGDADPSDPAGHGTHVASILGARSGDAVGIAGIANVRIMSVRVLDEQGHGTDADLASGIRWCVDHGARILSMSLSVDDRSKDVTQAVTYAASHGALLVASAGNAACGSPCQSAMVHPRALLTVTAVGPDGELASFGHWDARTDIAAPGVSIPGAYLGGKWVLGSGTSQAVPHVGGVAALVWHANPKLTAEQVAGILTGTSMRMGESGAHVVDAAAAVAKALGTR